MKQKLIAAAVVGAFAAPAVAFAQGSTVQVYGLLNAEYGFHSQADRAATGGLSSADALNSGASRIGLKGEEKLGGGMSAFFQCETDIRFLGGGSTTTTWCDRNSAIGLKGGFGSFYVGTWDAPLKRVAGITRITNETGWLGSQHMTLTSKATTGSFAFSNRNTQTLNYDTPKFGAFSASFQMTTTNAAQNTAAPNNALKGRIIGMSGQYVQGPLAVVLGYEKKDDNRAVGSANGLKDDAWLAGVAYTWGKLKVGFSYADVHEETAVATWRERKGWNLAADYKITGPGTIRAGYANAGDTKTSAGGGANTGAKQMQVSYLHSLSKRTTATVGYVRMNNDSAGTYQLTNITGPAIRAGDDSSAFVLGLTHTF